MINRSLTLALVALLLAGCTATTPRPISTGSAQESTLDRVERLIADSRHAQAEEAMALVRAEDLGARDLIRLRLARAELALADGQPLFALQDLPPVNATPDRALAARVEAVRSEVLLRMGDPAAAVVALVERDALLDRNDERRSNEDRIWQLLMAMPMGAHAQATFSGADRLTRGWFDLAMIARGAVPGTREQLLANWRSRYPDHPAAPSRALRPGTATAGLPSFGVSRPGARIGVLLPLTGPFGDAARAVRDGLMTAWYGDDERPVMHFYDTGSDDSGLLAAWQAALDGGAEFIIGPLRREAVQRIAQQGDLPVPVLALNYLDDYQGQLPFNLYQFGLAPEDEARAAASRMLAERQQRVVAMVPDTEWGARVLSALRERLEAGGGQLLEAQYISEGADHSRPIRALLNLDESEARNRALRGILGTSMEFEPRRRSDAQAIFLAARPDEAMAVRPQFRFHRSGDLPMYAVSLAWDGQRNLGPELRGLRVCDMPWMTESHGDWMNGREQLAAAHGRGFEARPRFYALGYDALRITQRLQQGWRAGDAFPGATGYLQLESRNDIRRELGCATLTRDGVEPLPPLREAPSARPLDDWLEDDGDDAGLPASSRW